jgi:diaminopimelate epimerase
MMEGAFCGNATMSLAALIAWDRHLPEGSGIDVPLEVSGAGGILTCRATVKEHGYIRGTVDMPLPASVTPMALTLDGRQYDVTVVNFDSIAHIIVPVEIISGDKKEFAEQAIREWHPLFDNEALGIILFEKDSLRIDPLVAVRSASTLVWEYGCGSGTAAVGAYLAHKEAEGVHADISQPGGRIAVSVGYEDDVVKSIAITGDVYVVARGVAYIQLP